MADSGYATRTKNMAARYLLAAGLMAIAAGALIVAQTPPPPEPTPNPGGSSQSGGTQQSGGSQQAGGSNQATIDGLRQKLDQKDAELEKKQEEIDNYVELMNPPPPDPRTYEADLGDKQEMWFFVYRFFSGDGAGLNEILDPDLPHEDAEQDHSYDKATAKLKHEKPHENAVKEANKLRDERNQLADELKKAGGFDPKGSVLQFHTPNHLLGAQGDAEEEARQAQEKEAANQKPPATPPPSPPGPISFLPAPSSSTLTSSLQTPQWVFAGPPSSVTNTLTSGTVAGTPLVFNLSAGSNFTNVGFGLIVNASIIYDMQNELATTEEETTELPAASEPVEPEQDARTPHIFWGPSSALSAITSSWLSKSAPYASSPFRYAATSATGSKSSGQRAAAQTASTSLPIKIFLVSNGRSSGEAFRMVIVNESSQPVRLTGDGFVLEPVARVTEQAIQQELKKLTGAGRVTRMLKAYCLEFAKKPPAAGTVFRLANQAAQDKFTRYRGVFRATRALRDAGRLSPGNDPTDATSYFDATRQWAIWTMEQGFDERGFGDAFVEHARKNVVNAGQRWNDELTRAVRALVPARWRAVQLVLEQVARTGQAGN